MGHGPLIVPPAGKLSRAEFRSWAAQQPRGRFERVDGEVIAMAPERVIHARVKARVFRALSVAIAVAGVPCEALPDGVTVEIGDGTDYEPDALVNCGEKVSDDAVAAPNPVVIVEVESPSTRGVDSGVKLADYFRVSSVFHYLIVRTKQRVVIHHRRAGDSIATAIVRDGPIRMDPPGISVDLASFYAG
jgi:Uma2 family endonuclease